VGLKFSTSIHTDPRAHLTSCTMGSESLFLGVKRPLVCVVCPPPSGAEAKEIVELQLHLFRRWAFMTSSRANFSVIFVFKNLVAKCCNEMLI